MKGIKTKIEELEKKLEKANAISEVYDEIVSVMQRNTMDFTGEYDSEGSAIYKDYDADYWNYENVHTKREIYIKVLEALEKML